MELTLKRLSFLSRATEGELYIDGQPECFTLEDRYRDGIKIYGQTCIPNGRYGVTISYSSRFKRRMPLLVGVPGFDGIRIHTGNKPEDTEGCILVGQDRTSLTDAWIGRSVPAYDALFTKIEDAIERGELVWITIEGTPNDNALANIPPAFFRIR
jgi:hypothetical protein